MQGEVIWRHLLEVEETGKLYEVTARRLGRRRFVVTAYSSSALHMATLLRIVTKKPVRLRTAHLEFFDNLKEIQIMEAKIKLFGQLDVELYE